ncbi:MAG: hypothetical protein HYR55_12540 [Acidobacteria bacterium]|nr:hypothetical protein [Acidobacteriota bacterium]
MLLVLGYVFIRRRQITHHKICMAGVFVTFIFFQISYVT